MGVKPKKCKCGCGKTFTPTRPMQPTSDDFDCKVRFAEQHAAKAREKRAAEQKRAERAEFKARKEKAKRPTDLAAEAQEAINRWVRLVRDRDAPCISCGRSNLKDPLTGGAWDCGHFRSRGAANHLRFEEANLAKQCKHCNRDLAGNSSGFRVGLVARIGEAAVVALECDNTARRYRADDYRQIRDTYREKLKAFKSKHEQ